MLKRFRDTSINAFVGSVIIAIFILSSASILFLVRSSMRHGALYEAKEKARIILDRNLSTHAYFSHQLKPSVFPLADKAVKEGYFDPTWMSSTFAIREIDKIFSSLNPEDYYYKECAINARSHENEADEYEASFIKSLNSDPELNELSEVRSIDGVQFLSVLRRGEIMEQTCLRCHSDPGNAPAGLVSRYGEMRSFGRSLGEVVSAVSIRVPLDNAYALADKAAAQLSIVLITALVFILGSVYYVVRIFIIAPINAVQEKAISISTDENRLGEEVPIPAGRELSLMSESFNRMSKALRRNLDELEQRVDARTSELKITNENLIKEKENVKVLTGMLPICASCKNIRDDKGYWSQIESYITEHSEAVFTHGLCPECLDKLYPEIKLKKDKEQDNK